MEKLYFADIHNETLIDIRSQHAFQKGHLKGSLNLNPGNFRKFAQDFLTDNQEIVFIIAESEQANLDEVLAAAKEMGYHTIQGYLVVEEIPVENLHTLPTISAEEFLKLNDNYTLLDVRHPDEITRPAPEKNLSNIPFEDLPAKNNTLDKNQAIYTLCGSGNRSTAAASYLMTKDFSPTVIEGGMKAIQELTQ